jgi:hypothetical protein
VKGPGRIVPVVLLQGLVACGPEPPPLNYCTTPPAAFGQAVTEWWIPRCSRSVNYYNDPAQALGPPNAAGDKVELFTGMVSLGFGGHVTVDMGGCVDDRPGNDIRVFQFWSVEPVSVYVAEAPEGPYTALGLPQQCGVYCDFDLSAAGVSRARFIRVEDGEIYPCPGDTHDEGADLDAVQALQVPTTTGEGRSNH